MDNSKSQKGPSYLSAPNVQLEKGTNSIKYLVTSAQGISSAVSCEILPAMSLNYFDIHASALPGELGESPEIAPVQFNYCISGRIELILEDGTCLYLKENDYVLSRQNSQSESGFPTGLYQGISLIFEPAAFCESNRALLEVLGLELSQLQTLYFDQQATYIGEAGKELKAVLDELWSLLETPFTFYGKLRVIELLHLLLQKESGPEKCYTFYTSTQVALAKKAEQLLTADLRKHIPVHQLAAQLGVGETSLKNYFRGVYGQNVSDYLRDLRMGMAAELLRETKLSVAEISASVGYVKQGKFAAVFRAQYNLNPLEYRRIKRIELVSMLIKNSSRKPGVGDEPREIY